MCVGIAFPFYYPKCERRELDNKMDSGVYHLLIFLRSGRQIEIGRLGCYWFPRGYYVYTGRAKKGLRKRLDRHWRHDKKRRWHIDFLLYHAQLIGEKKCLTRAERECLLNGRILRRSNAQVIVKKFGASDCLCITHLAYFSHRPHWLHVKRPTRRDKAMLTRA